MLDKPSKSELKYWEKVLHDHRLGVGRGRSSKIDYRGDENDLRVVEHNIVSKKLSRRVKPKGAKPE